MTQAEEPHSIGVERDGAVAVIVLDNPPLNLFRAETFSGLRAAREEIATSDARACVLRAEGRVFTGGVDVHAFERIEGSAEGTALAEQVIAELSGLERLEIPTLALVHGLCLTAGLELALGCDMIWATDDARFGLVERVVGLTPFGGGVQRIAERAGPARARELVMSGEIYAAPTMLDWGVINRVVPGDVLLDKGMRFAHQLAAGPTIAYRATKRLVRAYLDGGVAAADAVTPAEAGPLFDTEDTKRAVRSFLSEGPGKASFEGR